VRSASGYGFFGQPRPGPCWTAPTPLHDPPAVTLVACIGGGQLGRMLGLAGIPLGLGFRFLDPASDACAGAVGELVVGPYDDQEALARLAAGADVVTYEFENVPVEAAARVGAVPGVAALEHGQDRLREKELFRSLGIPTARFGRLEETRLPALVKTRRLGYDGKGQRRVDALEAIGDDELAEEVVPFERELSIVGVRGLGGETRFWPVGENVHRDGLLRATRAPARDAPQDEAEAICTALMEHLGYVGVLAVELFDVGGTLLANEFAPRVHNTAHWTIDGAITSQFENHLRAILGLPLGSTEARAPSVMVNLVGQVPPLDGLLALPGARLHLYGKEPRPGRKVGHVTLVDPDDAAVERLSELAA
jgi:5-(carboxyamino)imidazole ribonucleotide synthase